MSAEWQKRFWLIIAFAVFSLAITAQVVFRSKIWPFDWLMFLPTFLGDVIALIFSLGAGPMVLAFPFLVPTRSGLLSAKMAAFLACLSGVIEPISNLIYSFKNSDHIINVKTLIINGLTMLGVAFPIFIFVVFIPQIIIIVLKRRN